MIAGNRVGVIIPAAGSGTRLGGGVAKQFLDLQGIPILAHTLQRFEQHPAIDVIAIAGSSTVELITEIVRTIRASKVIWIGTGGPRRQDSVWNALQALGDAALQIVLIHDAVRPFVAPTLIDAVIDATVTYGAAIPVIPPNDTIKEGPGGGFVKITPDRSKLWMVQTPQGFRYDLIIDAYRQAEQDQFTGTDDASLVEHFGVPVKMVQGSRDNFKITTGEDLEIARYLASRKER